MIVIRYYQIYTLLLFSPQQELYSSKMPASVNVLHDYIFSKIIDRKCQMEELISEYLFEIRYLSNRFLLQYERHRKILNLTNIYFF